MTSIASVITDVASEVSLQRTNQNPNVTAFDFTSPLATYIDQGVFTPQPAALFGFPVYSDYKTQFDAAVNNFFAGWPDGGNSEVVVSAPSSPADIHNDQATAISTPPTLVGWTSLVAPFVSASGGSPAAAAAYYKLTPTSVVFSPDAAVTQYSATLTPAQQTAFRAANGLLPPSQLAAGASLAAYDQQSADI